MSYMSRGRLAMLCVSNTSLSESSWIVLEGVRVTQQEHAPPFSSEARSEFAREILPGIDRDPEVFPAGAVEAVSHSSGVSRI